MKKYIASFQGRRKGAIGFPVHFETMVEADNETDARLRLYDDYEHIYTLKLAEIAE